MTTNTNCSPEQLTEGDKNWCAFKLPRYRRGLADKLSELRRLWAKYLEAIEEGRALDRLNPGDGPRGDKWTPDSLIFARECSGRSLGFRREMVERCLRSIAQYREAIRIGEAARAGMVPAVITVAAVIAVDFRARLESEVAA
jgi:hypothetical protein